MLLSTSFAARVTRSAAVVALATAMVVPMVSVHAQDTQTDIGHQDVNNNNTGDTDEESAWQIPSGIPHFATDKGGRLPSTVGKEDGNHGSSETSL